MPQISVIVPVYHVEAYIHRCLDSILLQTFTDFELILIDDGSPDFCGNICDRYARNDQRVTVIHQENKGLSGARNAGIDYAMTTDSQWLCFVDSDDYVHPLYLESLYNAAQETGISVCQHKATHGESLPEIYSTSCSMLTPSEVFSLGIPFTVAWGKLYCKACFSTLRFPVGKTHEDEYLTYRIIFRFEIIPFISQPLYAYFHNPESIMHRPWTPQRLDALDAMEEQVAFYVNGGYPAIAEKIFKALIKKNRAGQKMLQAYRELSESERNALLHRLNRQIQRILLRYHRYRWCSIWKRGEDLWIWSDAFPCIHFFHMLWRRMKRCLVR